MCGVGLRLSRPGLPHAAFPSDSDATAPGVLCVALAGRYALRDTLCTMLQIRINVFGFESKKPTAVILTAGMVCGYCICSPWNERVYGGRRRNGGRCCTCRNP